MFQIFVFINFKVCLFRKAFGVNAVLGETLLQITYTAILTLLALLAILNILAILALLAILNILAILVPAAVTAFHHRRLPVLTLPALPSGSMFSHVSNHDLKKPKTRVAKAIGEWGFKVVPSAGGAIMETGK